MIRTHLTGENGTNHSNCDSYYFDMFMLKLIVPNCASMESWHNLSCLETRNPCFGLGLKRMTTVKVTKEIEMLIPCNSATASWSPCSWGNGTKLLLSTDSGGGRASVAVLGKAATVSVLCRCKTLTHCLSHCNFLLCIGSLVDCERLHWFMSSHGHNLWWTKHTFSQNCSTSGSDWMVRVHLWKIRVLA